VQFVAYRPNVKLFCRYADKTLVMLSHHVESRPMIVKLQDRLKTAGYKVSTDVGNMCTYVSSAQ